VVGDSLADGIWGSLYRRLISRKNIIVFRGAKNSVGFGSGDLLDALDKPFSAGAVDAVVMMIGANDRRAIYIDGKLAAAYHSAQWPAAYRSRVEHFMDAAVGRSVPMIWILLPSMREEDADADSKMINSIVISAAETRPLVFLLPTRAMTADAEGKYAAYLKDAKGQTRLVRDADGVHFAEFGYDMVADATIAKLKEISNKFTDAMATTR